MPSHLQRARVETGVRIHCETSPGESNSVFMSSTLAEGESQTSVNIEFFCQYVKITYNGFMGRRKSAYDVYVGWKIRRRRVELGLVQTNANNPHNRETLLDRIRKSFPNTSITDSTLQSIELGRGRLRLEDAVQICLALRMPLSDLLVESGKPFGDSILQPGTTNASLFEALDELQDRDALLTMKKALRLSAAAARLENLLDVCPLHNGLLDIQDLPKARDYLQDDAPDSADRGHSSSSVNEERAVVSRAVDARLTTMLRDVDEVLSWFHQSKRTRLIPEDLLARMDADCRMAARQIGNGSAAGGLIRDIKSIIEKTREERLWQESGLRIYG